MKYGKFHTKISDLKLNDIKFIRLLILIIIETLLHVYQIEIRIGLRVRLYRAID